jgi:endogenous inhibitor of DNA gyrase (YacG/DUF329 family)
MHPLLRSLGSKPRKGDVVPCAVCGTEFYRPPAYVAQGRKYCSLRCHGTAQRKPPVVKTCPQCGAEMRLRPSYGAKTYCSRACETIGRVKRPTGRTHNGKPVRLNEKGYVLIWEPEHPNRAYGGWQWEHRFVVEQALGRYLSSEEQVDHINGQKADNRLSNLQVLDARTHSMKTSAENLGALKTLRARVAEYERRFGPLEE